jgi:hypothetical protein
MKALLTLEDVTTPKMVSLAELRATLAPALNAVPWADDALTDLWKMGAPDPNASVCEAHCPEKLCPHVKRVLLPRQFKAWWQDVEKRMDLHLTKRLVRLRGKARRG